MKENPKSHMRTKPKTECKDNPFTDHCFFCEHRVVEKNRLSAFWTISHGPDKKADD